MRQRAERHGQPCPGFALPFALAGVCRLLSAVCLRIQREAVAQARLWRPDR